MMHAMFARSEARSDARCADPGITAGGAPRARLPARAQPQRQATPRLQGLLLALLLPVVASLAQAASPYPGPGAAAAARVDLGNALTACKGGKPGDACTYTNIGGTVSGHCAVDALSTVSCTQESVKTAPMMAAKRKPS